ncbi:relaxase/mobilization nuclease domain-containing protein [Phaeobacter gallaeciensis]|nr:relaxase/mobilization nuclease domain-containing protein [Phaeobacter gallaeciensis]MDE4063243.1 relaxase/mobilization nuclease domain-containing protein [Phaeobacter gallaeciensis]MDE4126268.1 relaxase/mobilization nuclease domain-containing protein [Phaeobacter gallaeciensis]MDE4130682.1 relaxase/mobilization nuclease domain-containing protein [Phaeobacter gallaeciensis]
MIGNPYKGKGFKGLLQYLHFGRKGEDNPHRVVWSEARNMPSTDPKVVAGIMRATSELSRGVKKPVYHLPISWPPEEQPPKEVQMQVADTLIADLGLSEHQYLIVAHDDGDCPHIHLVVNTVHPETGRVWNPWRDVYRIMESLERQEQELGLRIVDRPDLEELRQGKKDPARKKKASREEKLRATREGDTPLAKWSETEMRRIRADITNHFKEATSWAELEARLEAHGLHLKPAGQGFRITDGEHFMTLSKVGKHARQDRLEARFQETWEAYEIDREIDREVADQLEPPGSERPESILDELTQDADRQQSKERAESARRVKHALLAANRYAYFRGQEKQAKEAAQRHAKDRRAIRRLQWIKERVADDIGVANREFEDVCSQLYRNPRAAWAEIDRRLKAGESFEEIDLDAVGKKKGWKFLGFRSKGRKDANQAAKSMPRAHRKIERLRNQWEITQHDEMELYARLGESESRYNEAIANVGDRDNRRKRGLELWRERQNSVNQLSEQDIWQSELTEDEKEQLGKAWEETLDVERRREMKGQRNETVRDYYELLYERSKNKEKGREL